MAFILSADRRGSPQEQIHRFRAYQEYLHERRDVFPREAYRLATAEWYFSIDDERSPHDSVLQRLEIGEHDQLLRDGRQADISLVLLNAWQTQELTFKYTDVVRYNLELFPADSGHCDWRYDEFRLADGARVEHEIEWSGARASARWLIVASDVELSHVKLTGAQ